MNLTEIVFGCFRSAYLAYHGMQEHCGRGLITEAVRRVTQIAFDELGLHRLEANIQPANQTSIRLVRVCPVLPGVSTGSLTFRGRGLA